MMKKRLRALWRPSLGGRVFMALLLAYGLVWLALIGFEYLQRADVPRLERQMGSWMAYEAEALQGLATAPEAYAFTRSLAREFNRERRLDGRPDALLELREQASGRRLFWMQDFELQGSAAAPQRLRFDGRDYLLFSAPAGPWQLRLAFPVPSLREVAEQIGGALNVRLAITLPCLLIPVWLAVRRGLSPLRRLSEGIAARREGDLAPLGVTPRHRELQPLVQALDGLLAQLRQKLAREHGFVQDAAHELRTPLAVLSAQVNVLALARDDDERRRAEAAAEAAIARASHLIQQLLDLALVDAATATPPAMLDLAALAGEAVAQRVPAALRQGQEWVLEAPPQLPWRVERHAFLSVLHNLLDNALHYAGSGARVVVALQGDAQGLQLRVSDDGPGFAPAERAQAFERFWRGKGHAVAGAGLGLAIARQAALRMGGQLSIEKAGLAGRGCSLLLVLPQSA